MEGELKAVKERKKGRRWKGCEVERDGEGRTNDGKGWQGIRGKGRKEREGKGRGKVEKHGYF